MSEKVKEGICLFVIFFLAFGFILVFSITGIFQEAVNKPVTGLLIPKQDTLKQDTLKQVNSVEFYTKASWYGKPFHGRKTANGQVYDMYKLTCAAPEPVPFGTKLLVTCLANNKQIIVTVNDRGPFIKDRGLDLSYAAMDSIADPDIGVINIKYKILKE